MSCRSVQAELVDAYYGDLTVAEQAAVRAHVLECAACARADRALRQILDAITPEAAFPREAEVDWGVPLTCQAVRAELATFLRAGEGEHPAVEDHLARCRACADESAAISATLAAVQGAFPGEAHVDWDAFARHTAQRARREEHTARTQAGARVLPFSGARIWRAAASMAAAAAVITIGVLVLRQTTTPPPPAPVTTAQQPAEAVTPTQPSADPLVVAPEALLQRTRLELAKSDAARYLADSRNLLVSFAELPVPCDGDTVDVSVERQVSARLLKRKQYLERDLNDVEVARARRLADEVETLLAEIALLENCVPPYRVREIRELVRERQLMMRIEILTDELGAPRGSRA